MLGVTRPHVLRIEPVPLSFVAVCLSISTVTHEAVRRGFIGALISHSVHHSLNCSALSQSLVYSFDLIYSIVSKVGFSLIICG